MNSFLWTTQAILFLFYTEEYLRKNDSWNKVYQYLGQGWKFFLSWRSDANIIEEMNIIIIIFRRLAQSSLFLLSIMGITFFSIPLIIVFLISLMTLFSFNFVFNHKNTIKEFKPIAYIYGFIGIILLYGIINNDFYSSEIISLAQDANIVLPTQAEILIQVTITFILIFCSFYIFMWLISLFIPMLILIPLFITTKISILIENRFNKKTVNGIIGLIQFIIFYLFYRVSN